MGGGVAAAWGNIWAQTSVSCAAETEEVVAGCGHIGIFRRRRMDVCLRASVYFVLTQLGESPRFILSHNGFQFGVSLKN